MNLPSRRNRALRGMGDCTSDPTLLAAGIDTCNYSPQPSSSGSTVSSTSGISGSGMSTNTVYALLGIGAVLLLFASKR